MVNVRIALRGAALASVAAVTLAACGGGSSNGTGASSGAPSASGGAPSTSSSAPSTSATAAGTKGGTLTFLTNDDRIQDLDPQRNYTGDDLAFASAYITRSLTTYQMSTDAVEGQRDHPGRGDRHRYGVGRPEDLDVHAQGRDQVAGRLARHLR